MGNKWSWLGLLALVALAACGGGSKTESTTPGDETAAGGAAGEGGAIMPGDNAPLPAIPASPAAEPDSLLTVISLGEPTSQLGEVAAFVDAIQPGMGAMVNLNQFMPMLAGAVGAPGLEGLALDKPIWLVGLDPKKTGGASTVLVATVGDEAKLKSSVSGTAEAIVHDGYVAVGTRAALRASAPWALSSLTKAAPRKELALVVYMQRMMSGYGNELESAIKEGMGASQRPEEKMAAEAMFAVVKDIDRLEGSLVAGAQGAEVSGWIVPTAGSKLAQFVALQQPTDYGFAARLGKIDWPVLVAARLDFGPFKDFVTKVATAAGGPHAEMAQVLELIGSEHAFAFAKQGRSFSVRALVGLTDGAGAGKLLETAMGALAKAGPIPFDSMTGTLKLGALKAKGGVLHEIGFAPGSDPAAAKEHDAAWGKAGMKVFFGVVGGYLVADLEKNGKAAATTLAGNASAKSVKPGFGKLIAAAIAASVERKESVLWLMDIGQLVAMNKGDKADKKAPAQAAPMAIGFGFADGKIAGRVHLPIEQVTQVAKQLM